MSVLILQGNVSEIKDFGKVQCGDPPNIEKNSIIYIYIYYVYIYIKWRNWLIQFPMLGELWGTPSLKPAWNMDLSWLISHIWHKKLILIWSDLISLFFAGFHNWIPQKPWGFHGFSVCFSTNIVWIGMITGGRASALLAPLPASASGGDGAYSTVDRCWQGKWWIFP